MVNLIKNYPENWAKDSLSEFQNHAFRNEVAAVKDLPNYTLLVAEIDSIFHAFTTQVMDNLKDPSEVVLGLLMMINAHNHFRATARLTLSGQCLSAYATARACLETSMYGWYLLNDTSRVEIWRTKPNVSDRDASKKWSNTFAFSTIAKAIGRHEEPLEGIVKRLHQTAIDFGAHPNKDALYSNLTLAPHPKGHTVTITHLHVEGMLFEHTFSHLIDTGLVALILVKLGCPDIAIKIDLISKLNKLMLINADIKKELEDLYGAKSILDSIT